MVVSSSTHQQNAVHPIGPVQGRQQDHYQDRTTRWTQSENNVCHCIVLHHDLHDLSGIREHRCGNGQRENLFHLHDDRGW